MPWRRQWQLAPVFLQGTFHGQSSLVGYSPGGCKELDTTDWVTEHIRVYERPLTCTTEMQHPECVSFLTNTPPWTCTHFGDEGRAETADSPGVALSEGVFMLTVLLLLLVLLLFVNFFWPIGRIYFCRDDCLCFCTNYLSVLLSQFTKKWNRFSLRKLYLLCILWFVFIVEAIAK